MRWTASAMNKQAGAIMVAAALLLFDPALMSGKAHAQSSGNNGVSTFLGNLFSGQKSAPSPQATPGPDGAPPPWSGEDGASGHPLMTASAIREAAANFPKLRRRDVARCRTPRHHASQLRALHGRARA
jgi:membrane-bound lytic murein transglycosylase B